MPIQTRKIILIGSIILVIIGMGLIVTSFYTITQSGTTTPTEIYQDPTALADYVKNLPKQELSETEIQGILYMREEEKLARDVYTVLYDKWGSRIYLNIAHSEQIHMDMVKVLIEKYNLSDPVVNDTTGEFTNTHIRELYSELIVNGSRSLEDAYRVGALIEEIDIIDLNNYIAKTDNEDVKVVYEFLKWGSYNHLRAFVKQLNNMGIEYTPVLLSQEEYNEIISETPSMGAGHNTQTTTTTEEYQGVDYYFYGGLTLVIAGVGLAVYIALKKEA